MTKHTRRVLELGVGLALALTIVLTVCADWHQRTAAQVRADTLRLHILANSDTLDDQLLKLQVRDAVLAALPPAVTKAATPDEAAADTTAPEGQRSDAIDSRSPTDRPPDGGAPDA